MHTFDIIWCDLSDYFVSLRHKEYKMFSILPATLADCPFVARCICMALHHEASDDELPYIAQICARPDVLYSYRHALIGWLDDVPVGLCLAYDGDGYHETRLRTFALFAQNNEAMDLEHAEDETCAGEFYIDSLAVLPPYRRHGYARQLMQAQMARGRQMGLTHQTLLVDPDNPQAQALYAQLGFSYESDCYAFGQTFLKWGVQ